METLSQIWTTLQEVNNDIQTLFPSIPLMNEEEYAALMGRYAESHIRYDNRTQFKLAFFTYYKEAQERLRAKLRINHILRNLEESEALGGVEVITNIATNPDTDPDTGDYGPLPFVNSQNRQKEKLSKVSGLYNWKHSVGGQAYNEFLDAFKLLFRVIMIEEEVIYEE
jgi:hypothetical protein